MYFKYVLDLQTGSFKYSDEEVYFDHDFDRS